jgi:hypothetical protein
MRTSFVAATLALLLGLTEAQSSDFDAVRQLQEMMPSGARCGEVAEEKLVYCRYLTSGPSGVALEIGDSDVGPTALLSYNAADATGHRLLDVMRKLFSKAGVKGEAFDDCLRQSLDNEGRVESGQVLLKCRSIDLFDRVTHEVFSEPRARRGMSQMMR